MNLKTFLFLAVASMLFFSCKKKDKIKKDYSEILEWSYGIGESDSPQDVYTTPAVDENDNIYFVSNREYNSCRVNSLTKDGQERWKQDISGKIITKLIYKSGKVYGLFQNTDGYTWLYCLDAKTGNTLWNVKHPSIPGDIATSDNAVYWQMQDSLFKFSFDGAMIANRSFYDDPIICKSIALFKNKIYLLGEAGSTEIVELRRLTDDGTTISQDWKIEFTSDNGFESMSQNRTACLAIDNEGTCYIVDRYDLAAVASDGSIKWRIERFGALDNMGDQFSVVINDSGNIYMPFEQIYKLNKDGNTLSQTENNYSLATSNDINYAPIIGADKKIYFVGNGNDGGGIKAMNPDASISWYTLEPQGSGNTTILHNGNIIFINDKVYCIKADAKGLDTDAEWPKVYYDYGNTCYKK